MPAAQYRNWLFTINNPDESIGLLDIDFDFCDATYLVYQLEVGEQGTPHFQGYVEFSKKKSLAAVRDMQPLAHWENRRGSADQADDYCTKAETRLEGPWRQGERKTQGARSDLLLVKRKLDDGVDETVIADDHFGSWVRYHKSFREYKRMKTAVKTRDGKPYVTVIFSKLVNVGKTYFAAHDKDMPAFFKRAETGIWWDGYNQEPVIIFDEFMGKHYPYTTITQLCDEHPVQMQVKGGMTHVNPKFVYFTSNYEPGSWWSNCPWEPFQRRVDRWIHFCGYKKYYSTERAGDDRSGSAAYLRFVDHCGSCVE